MHNEQTKDSLLWGKLQKGGESDFSAFYDAYIDFLFSMGLVYTNDRDLIKDSIHDLFVDLYKYRRKLSHEVNVKGYLVQSLRRKIYQNLKRAQKLSLLESITDSDQLDLVEEAFADKGTDDRMHAILSMIDALPTRQKEALVLKYQKDFSYPEIAQVMEISVDSARTLIYRTIKTLRKNLDIKSKESSDSKILLHFFFHWKDL